MFDSTPSDFNVSGNYALSRNQKILDRLAHYRREAKRTSVTMNAKQGRENNEAVQANDQVTLDLVAKWNADNATLRDCIEMVSDWGPFELVDITAAFRGDDGDRRVLCRFAFHGAAKEFGQFEHSLRESLNKVTYWETARSSAA